MTAYIHTSALQATHIFTMETALMSKDNTTDRYLALDIGAQSGRAILGELSRDAQSLKIKEIYRFQNRPVMTKWGLCWDFNGILSALHKEISLCRGLAGLRSIGIDTWGVDFCLYDRKCGGGNIIGLPNHYRDSRTRGVMQKFFEIIDREQLYRLTGTQCLEFNTLFQLYSMVLNSDRRLKKASVLRFIPDALNYELAGCNSTEFTIATTSQLYNLRKNRWEPEIIEACGINPDILQNIIEPGETAGTYPLKGENNPVHKPSADSSCTSTVKVVSVASHDTASAVAAIPTPDERFAFISLGTWALIGVETDKPIITKETFNQNITNEGGVFGTVRVLKNAPGMWMLARCMEEWEMRFNGSEPGKEMNTILRNALKSSSFPSIIYPSDSMFFNPESMVDSILRFCDRTGQRRPRGKSGVVRTLLYSLALTYGRTIDTIKEATGKAVSRIHIVGGGARCVPLCRLIAECAGLPVYAGPSEATSIGNILVQAYADEKINSLRALRRISSSSFRPAVYFPSGHVELGAARDRFEKFSVQHRQ